MLPPDGAVPMNPPTPASRTAQRARAGLPMIATVFLAALGVRALTYPSVVTPSGVRFPFAGDLFYHMRRIWFSAVNFPANLDFDSYVSFPHGAPIVWPAAYDWTIAAVARGLAGAESQGAVESVAIWVPPLLGAATAAAAAAMAVRLYGRAAGWGSGLLFAILPISFVFSQLGQLDHHVAVALATTAMLGVGLALLARTPSPTPALGGALGLAMGAVILMWPGALLHVGIIQAVTAVWWLEAADRDVAVRRGWSLLAAQVVCAFVVAPFSIGLDWPMYGAWSPLVLSNFQATYFGAAALAIGGTTWLHARTGLGLDRSRRLASALGLAAIGVGCVLAVAPAVREALAYASGWFAREEDFQSHVNELRPLLSPRGEFDPRLAMTQFLALFWLFPVAWATLAVRAWRERSAAQGLLLAWAAVFLVLALAQWRFGNSFSVVYAIVLGSAIGAWVGWLRDGAAPRWMRFAVAAVLVVVAVATSGTLERFYGPPILRSLSALSDPALRERGPLSPQKQLFSQAGRWMAAHTPETGGYLDPAERPEYGVLCNWGVGHMLRYRSERPMVQDNFGVYGGRETYEAAWEYYAAEDEEKAIDMLDALGVRYVVAGRLGAGSTERAEPRSMTRRLAQAFGSELRLVNGMLIPALARHRLIFHAHTADEPGRRGPLVAQKPHHSIGIWETVPGARIAGLAPPETRVEARLELRVESGRSHRYVAATEADVSGRYSLVVPYPTDKSFSPAVSVEGEYVVASAGREEEVRVTEDSIRNGSRVEGPDF